MNRHRPPAPPTRDRLAAFLVVVIVVAAGVAAGLLANWLNWDPPTGNHPAVEVPITDLTREPCPPAGCP